MVLDGLESDLKWILLKINNYLSFVGVVLNQIQQSFILITTGVMQAKL